MLSVLHFLAVLAHGLGLLFPIVFWRFSSENGPEMTYRLGEITYQAAVQLSPSTLDNKPLLYLNIALMALHLWLGIGKGPKELKVRLYNASALLSAALVFSVVVTAYRAEAGITNEVFSRSFEAGAWGLGVVFPLALSAYLMARYGNR